jgi:hypothetical protein
VGFRAASACAMGREFNASVQCPFVAEIGCWVHSDLPGFCALVLLSGKSAKKSPNQPQFSVRLFFAPWGTTAYAFNAQGVS